MALDKDARDFLFKKHDTLLKLAAHEDSLVTARSTRFLTAATVLLTTYALTFSTIFYQDSSAGFGLLRDVLRSFISAAGIFIAFVWRSVIFRTVIAVNLWRGMATKVEEVMTKESVDYEIFLSQSKYYDGEDVSHLVPERYKKTPKAGKKPQLPQFIGKMSPSMYERIPWKWFTSVNRVEYAILPGFFLLVWLVLLLLPWVMRAFG